MHDLTADSVLWASVIVAEAVLAITIWRRGLSGSYPILLTYLLFNLVEDPLAWVFFKGPRDFYIRFYFAVTILDYLLQFLLILEIARNVLQPSRRSLPFRLWPAATITILGCTVIAASFSPGLRTTSISIGAQWFSTVTLGLAVLKLLLFCALAGFAQLLGIGWRSRVLQVATGLAFYGACSLLIQLFINHIRYANTAAYPAQFVKLTQMQSLAYLTTLLFWTWSLSRNEAPRKDFTPQMQQVLVTIAQSAKRTRLAVTRSTDRR